MADEELALALSPVEEEGRPGESEPITPGPALALSGGGYRAMLFHLGSLWRLNEAGILGGMQRISCVSGGSITGATLGLKWQALQFHGGTSARFVSEVVEPIRTLASRTIDRAAILGGVFLPGSVWERVSAAYDKHLFRGATLQDLPPGPPRVVLNATNVQSGALFRFMRPYMRDWKVGEWKKPTTSLADAVAASSACPPVLSPVTLSLDPAAATSGSWAPGFEDPAFREHVVLTDGGVYDNLGLETVWKRFETVFVSDGGGSLGAELEPHEDWARHALRVNGLIDSQVRALRKRQIVGSLVRGIRSGAYWSIHLDPSDPDWKPHFRLSCSSPRTRELAETPTRLARLEVAYQERLINWGYAVCDATLRRFNMRTSPVAPSFPYPGSGV